MQKGMKQNNTLRWGEQGGSLLPTNQVQVGHKGGKWWGKESANISMPECRGSASLSVFYFSCACHLPCVHRPFGDWDTPGVSTRCARVATEAGKSVSKSTIPALSWIWGRAEEQEQVSASAWSDAET